MVSKDIKLLIPRIQKFFDSQPVERAWLFGSCSRGEEVPDSDIDILVKYTERDRITLFTISRMINSLGNELKRNVDLVEEDCILPFAAKSANRDKILIYEKKLKIKTGSSILSLFNTNFLTS